MSGAICIDFGTSSIRAVRRLPGGKLKPLAIGRVTNSQLDDASIRSEIHIDHLGRYVRFGERALKEAMKSPEGPLLFEASPKLWLREPERLQEPAADGLDLSREDLLAGLLAYAVTSAAEADGITVDTLKKLDLRIAHPVWPAQIKTAANAALARLCGQARQMALDREWGTVTVGVLREYTQAKASSRHADADVDEPVAAAVELLPDMDNIVRICAVVDVGAGTTDIGLFLSLVPTSGSPVRSKLYSMGKPISVFKAGNQIDAIVLELIEARARRPSTLAMADIKARIRGIKETLFRDGYVQELGTDLQLEDVQSHPLAKAMAKDIRFEIEAAVQANAEYISTWMNKPVHSVSRLDLVMAGGGGTIGFLRKAIEKSLEVQGRRLPIKVTVPVEQAGMQMFGASRGRMAVALGGASQDYDAVQHEQPALTTIRRGRI